MTFGYSSDLVVGAGQLLKQRLSARALRQNKHSSKLAHSRAAFQATDGMPRNGHELVPLLSSRMPRTDIKGCATTLAGQKRPLSQALPLPTHNLLPHTPTLRICARPADLAGLPNCPEAPDRKVQDFRSTVPTLARQDHRASLNPKASALNPKPRNPKSPEP